MSTAPFPLKGRYCPLVRFDSWRLGPVYEARDDGEGAAGRRVMVQVLNSHIAGDAEVVGELERGFSALSAHRPPGLVEILDFDRDERFLFVLMEHLEGATARAVLDDAGALPFAEAAPIVRAVGDALQFLHSESIEHGNVGPETVFITFDDEVRLIDVVPVRAGWSPSAGGAGPPSDWRTGERDDVFGLACLAYELTAGRHPFAGAGSPAEAKRAGLTPAPIASLSERQWQALERGLALDAEQRTLSAAAFLADWDGGEPEQSFPSSESDRAIELELEPATADPPRTRPPETRGGPPSASAPSAALVTSPPFATSAAHAQRTQFDRDRAYRPPPKTDRSSGSPVVVAVVALGILAAVAWFYSPALRQATGDLIVGRTGQPVPAAEPGSGPADSPARAVDGLRDGAGRGASSSERDAGGARGTLPASPTPVEDKVAVAPAGRSEVLDRPSTIGAGSEPATEPAATTEAVPEPTTAATNDSTTEPTTEPTPVPEPAPAPEPEPPQASQLAARAEFEIEEASITVRESAGFVSIPIRRTGATEGPASVFWWTSQGSATAGDDYADFGEKGERFAAGEAVLTLLIPLVNDGLAEPTEQFFVYAGRRNEATGALDPVASTRVRIDDDD